MWGRISKNQFSQIPFHIMWTSVTIIHIFCFCNVSITIKLLNFDLIYQSLRFFRCKTIGRIGASVDLSLEFFFKIVFAISLDIETFYTYTDVNATDTETLAIQWRVRNAIVEITLRAMPPVKLQAPARILRRSAGGTNASNAGTCIWATRGTDINATKLSILRIRSASMGSRLVSLKNRNNNVNRFPNLTHTYPVKRYQSDWQKCALWRDITNFKSLISWLNK